MTETRQGSGITDRVNAFVYDFGAPAVFFPLGGINALREKTLDALDIRPQSSVLELGCGTGALSEKLIARGAVVTAVDRSEAMLRRARRRAPSAKFLRGDILNFQCEQKFDRALIDAALARDVATAHWELGLPTTQSNSHGTHVASIAGGTIGVCKDAVLAGVVFANPYDDSGIEPVGSDAATFARFVDAEQKKWKSFVDRTGIKLNP